MTLCYSRKNIPVAHFLLALATVLQKQRCSCKAILWCIVTLCKDSQLLEILSWRAVLQCKEEVSLIFEALHPSFQQQGTNLGGPYLTSLASLRFPLSLLFSSEVQHTLTFPNIYIPHWGLPGLLGTTINKNPRSPSPVSLEMHDCTSRTCRGTRASPLHHL